MGKFLRGRRDQVVLVSKGGVPWNESEKRYECISSREQLTEDLEGSLRRLQTDYLDLYLIHWPDESRLFSGPMEVLADFQSQGKIRYGGVSNFSAEQVRESLETFPSSATRSAITCSTLARSQRFSPSALSVAWV